jgi:hypothetical protein
MPSVEGHPLREASSLLPEFVVSLTQTKKKTWLGDRALRKLEDKSLFQEGLHSVSQGTCCLSTWLLEGDKRARPFGHPTAFQVGICGEEQEPLSRIGSKPTTCQLSASHKSLHLSVPQFLYLQNGPNNSTCLLNCREDETHQCIPSTQSNA